MALQATLQVLLVLLPVLGAAVTEEAVHFHSTFEGLSHLSLVFQVSADSLKLLHTRPNLVRSFSEKLQNTRALQAGSDSESPGGQGRLGHGVSQATVLQRDFARSIRMVVGDLEPASTTSIDGALTVSTEGELDGGNTGWTPTSDSGEEWSSDQGDESNTPPNNAQDVEAPTTPSSTLSWLKESFLAVTERVLSPNPVQAGPPEPGAAQPDTSQGGDSYYSDAFRASQGVQVFDDPDSEFDSVPRTPLGLLGVGSVSSDPPAVTSFG